MKIALISCSQEKLPFSSSAKDMYMVSQLFRKVRTSVESQNFDNWFILSAKYGLLDKNTVIEPYNVFLGSFNKQQKNDWADKVVNSVIELKVTEVSLFAGRLYRELLVSKLEGKGIKVLVPLQGLGIGQQLKLLKEEQYKNDSIRF